MFEEQAEKYDFSYVPIWGNHDRHGIYSPNWLARKFKNSKHCIYIELNDDLYGRSNFVINLMGNDKVQWQLSHIDSGASFSESSLSPFRDYDYIRKDQTDWYIKENELAENAPTIAYYHIPQQDNLVAFNERNEKGYKNKFFKLEGFGDNGNEKYASDFIKIAKEHNLKGAFMGHAHNVDWTVDYDGVVMGLGVKTGPELYYAHIDPNSGREDMKEGLASLSTPINEKFDLIGASLVTLTEETNYVSGAFNLEHLYLNERKTGDFISWQEW